MKQRRVGINTTIKATVSEILPENLKTFIQNKLNLFSLNKLQIYQKLYKEEDSQGRRKEHRNQDSFNLLAVFI